MTSTPTPNDNDPWDDDPKMKQPRYPRHEFHNDDDLEDYSRRSYFWLGIIGGLITGLFWRELIEVARDLITNL